MPKEEGKKECAKEDERGRRERANNASSPVHPSRDSGEYFTQPCVLRNEFIAKNAGTHLFPILSFSFSLYSFLSRRVLRTLFPRGPGRSHITRPFPDRDPFRESLPLPIARALRAAFTSLCWDGWITVQKGRVYALEVEGEKIDGIFQKRSSAGHPHSIHFPSWIR